VWLEIAALVTVICYTRYAGQTIEEIRKSRTATAKQLEEAERPWVSVGITVASPLVFDDAGAHMTIALHLNNHGHSPALRAVCETRLVRNFVENRSPDIERTELCKEAVEVSRNSQNAPVNTTWFPGDQPPIGVRVGISQADIHKELVLVACVAYQPQFTQTVYQTSVMYDVTLPEIRAVLPKMGAIPADQLILRSLETLAN
jgi:hypothetical protein